METFITLLRGINVGGHKKVPMAELRQLLTKEGFEDVQTYIQSGNIIFRTSFTKEPDIEKKVNDVLSHHFGFEVSVLVRSRKALKKIFDNCPFEEEKKKASYFAIFQSNLDEGLIEKAMQRTYEDEEFVITDNCIYFFAKNGYGKAKFSLNYFERLFKTPATARNYNTLLKLLSLSA